MIIDVNMTDNSGDGDSVNGNNLSWLIINNFSYHHNDNDYIDDNDHNGYDDDCDDHHRINCYVIMMVMRAITVLASSY